MSKAPLEILRFKSHTEDLLAPANQPPSAAGWNRKAAFAPLPRAQSYPECPGWTFLLGNSLGSESSLYPKIRAQLRATKLGVCNLRQGSSILFYTRERHPEELI